MKEHLPFQAQWTARLLTWILQRNVNLEELITDEDVVAGIVSYFTKKVAVDEAAAGQAPDPETESLKKALEEELDFVKCRLAGADQQRENETKKLDERNAELRQQIVNLTQKVKAGEKEIFESKFAVGKIKASLKQAEEESRDYKRSLERKNEAFNQLKKQFDQINEESAVARDKIEQIGIANGKAIEKLRVDFEMEKVQWEKERQKLLYMLSERDNALSEAREGQAAATREIQNIQNTLDKKESRLTLLEIEAVKQGVPMIKVGDEPVVGTTVAEAMLRDRQKVVENPNEENETWTRRSRKKNYNKTPEPNSSIEIGDRTNGVDFSSDTRPAQLSDIEIDQPETAADGVRRETIEDVGVDFNVDVNTAEPLVTSTAAPVAAGGETSRKGRRGSRRRAPRTVTTSDAAAKPAAKPVGKKESKPAAKPAAKTVTKVDTKPAAKPAAKPEGKKESRPAAKPAAKTVTKVDTKPAAKPEGKKETRPAAKPAAKTEAKPDGRPAAKVDTKPAAKPAAKPVGKREPRPAAKPATTASAKPAAKPAAKPQTKPTAKPRAKSEGKKDTKQATRPPAKPASKPAAKPKAKPTTRK